MCTAIPPFHPSPRSLKEEALKDVLDDSEDDRTSVTPTAPTGVHREGEACSGNRKSDGPSTPVTAPSKPTAPEATSWSNGSSSPRQDSRQQRDDRTQGLSCYVGILPPDLLLQCAEFLGDTQSLCRVREVSLGWLVALDDREAGRRLWRPVFYRLRASGSIHAATDATGQRRRQLKVYDLTTASPNTSRGAASALRDGAVVSTPSPAKALAAGSSVEKRSWLVRELSQGSTPVSEAGSLAGTVPRRASACLVCGLIQRQGYTGRDCEMCASSLMLVQGRESSDTPRVAYTRVKLSGSAGKMSSSASPASIPLLTSSSPSRRISSASGDVSIARGGNDGREDGGAGGVVGDGIDRDEEKMGSACNVDWHFLVKRLAEEKRVTAGWGSLRHGWVWLQGELQVSEL